MCFFWKEEEPLGGARRNVHEVVSLKLAGSFKSGFPQSPPHFSFSYPIGLSSPASYLDWLANCRT